jgi:ATP-dependent helicase HrpB
MKQNEKVKLPIDSHIDEILEAVRNYSTIIVKATPGSGKTTRLPWAISKGLNSRVVVLEPRRLAAKLAAQRIAEEENLSLGHEVGYHFRFEKNATPETKVVFYTEGTFLKRFLNDQNLNEVDVVILDEFHERHIDTDLALALLRDLQKKRNLKLVLMSATLDLELLKTFEDSKIIEIEGVTYPVVVTYLPNQPSVLSVPLPQKVKKVVDATSGDTLVFLPGMREMLRVQEVLHGDYNVFLLHADLSKEEQSSALQKSDKRKIILATNIAESSVTIPGIKVVIDSGIQRQAWFSPWNGLKFIQDSPVTKSSAVQRAGRAGRTGPGECHRLYGQHDFNEREEHTIPEIHKSDLTDVCLLVAGTGLTPRWFQAPSAEKWKKSCDLLKAMNALDEENKITPTGLEMLQYPLDARLARILLEGESLNANGKKALLTFICEEIEKDKSGVLKRRLQNYLHTAGSKDYPWEKCLLIGFVDQVGKYREKQRDFIHYSGKILKAHQGLHDLQEGYYIILDITQKQEAISVIEIQEEWLWEIEPFPFREDEEIQISPKVVIKKKTRLGSIPIDETQIKVTWSSLGQELQKRIIKEAGVYKNQEIKKWKESPEGERLSYWARIQKLNFDEIMECLPLQEYFEAQDQIQWDDFPFFVQSYGIRELNVVGLDKELPTKINLGGKRELTVHYPEGMDPYLEAPIQDFYGLSETPTILNGKIPLTLKLLGPHKRPIQVTRDLKSFWHKTYQEMKKEYQRDYPRHYWPEKPWEARPFLLKSHLPKV